MENLYRMKLLSLKLDDEIAIETDKIAAKMKMARNRYINEALKAYNHFNKRRLLKKRLKFESELARESSMKVLREYERITNEFDKTI